VVRTHPETRRKGLFVNPYFTASIKGMKSAESAALLNFLYRSIELPDFSCRLRWHNKTRSQCGTIAAPSIARSLTIAPPNVPGAGDNQRRQAVLVLRKISKPDAFRAN
jgi:hypothetical protein